MLSDPISAYLQAAQQRNQNRRESYQDLGALGQSIGQGVGDIGQQFKQQKQKQQWQQTISGLMQDPNMPPQMKQMLPMLAQRPELAGQLLPGMMKPQKQPNVFRPVGGMMSEQGNPLIINEATGEMSPANIKAKSTSKGSASDLGTITWDSLSPEEQGVSKALYNADIRPYDLGYRERSKAVVGANIYANMNGLPPYRSFGGDVKAGTAKAFATGKPGLNVLSLNTAIGHAKSALDAYQNVKNTDTRLLNIPLNKARTMSNDPNIIKLGVTLNALQGELATVFKGTAGTDQEIGKWMQYLSQDLTPTQAVGAIQQVNELLNSRLSALDQMRSQGTSNRPATGPLLSPHAKQLSTQFNQMGRVNSGSDPLGILP